MCLGKPIESIDWPTDWADTMASVNGLSFEEFELVLRKALQPNYLMF